MDLNLKEKKTRFKGHETFYFRDGWIPKVFDTMNNKRISVFSNVSDDIANLGIGANMVKSIKYWMVATNLIRYDRIKKQYILTTLGETIANNDQYLEQINTLWIIHAKLVCNYEQATTWNIFFNEFKGDYFDAKDVSNYLKNWLNNNNLKYTEKSLDSDVNVLLNMYSNQSKHSDPEENFECPLSRLDMFEINRNHYTRKVPNIDNLHELIIFYAILLMIPGGENESKVGKSISLNNISVGHNSPVNLFNLNRIILNEYLDSLSSHGYIRMDRTAGLDMIYIETDKTENEIIKEYYGKE